MSARALLKNPRMFDKNHQDPNSFEICREYLEFVEKYKKLHKTAYTILHIYSFLKETLLEAGIYRRENLFTFHNIPEKLKEIENMWLEKMKIKENEDENEVKNEEIKIENK